MNEGITAERARHAEVRTMHPEASAAWPHLDPLHPAWRAFFRFCSELHHG